MTVMAQQDTVSSLSGKRIWLKRSRYSDILATNSTQLNTGRSDIKECPVFTLLGTNWNNGTNTELFYWNLNNVASNRNCNISDHFTAMYSYVSEVLKTFTIKIRVDSFTLPL